MDCDRKKRELNDVDEAGPPEKMMKMDPTDPFDDIPITVGDAGIANDLECLAELLDPLESAPTALGEIQTDVSNANDAPEIDPSEISLDVFEHLPGLTRGGTWSDTFLGLIEDDEIRESIRSFSDAHRPSNWTRGKSLEDIDHPSPGDEDNWANHDPEITERWNSVVEDLYGLLGEELTASTLCKPSGPLDAILTCRWHYPSFTTKKLSWGHVADRTNPCLQTQFRKVGSNPYIRTENLYPIRVDYAPLKGRRLFFEHAQQSRIEKICFDFIKWLDSRSKFLILLGEENFKCFDGLIEVKEGCEAKKVELRCPGIPGMYGKTPSIVVIRDKITHDIQQVAFFSFHSQTFFHGGLDQICFAAYHDVLWNAVLELSGLQILSANSFLVTAKRSIALVRKPAAGKNYGRLKLAFGLRAEEKSTGILLEESLVQRIFKTFYEKDSEIFDMMPLDASESHVSRVIRVQSYKAAIAREEQTRKQLRGKRMAFGRVKQVAEIVAKPKPDGFYEYWIRSLALEFPTFSSNNRNNLCWVGRHVQWWSEEYPGGLRWSGDGCTDPDNFPYEEKYHPAVSLRRDLTWEEREMLKPPEKRHPEAEAMVKRLTVLPY
ncbi:hypothetical protein M426DRAFT_22891 [Hypoxylon sp. CI-4A]|nr:hypothetical protein M426DRAFT_22891 [Hypoxylon sp. CI-4A]